jgi:hypothetical protein
MQNVNEGHSGTKRKHRNRPAVKPKSAPVTTIKPSLILWTYAISQTSGDPHKLLWLDSERVIVCNSRAHRDYMRKVYARV